MSHTTECIHTLAAAAAAAAAFQTAFRSIIDLSGHTILLVLELERVLDIEHGSGEAGRVF